MFSITELRTKLMLAFGSMAVLIAIVSLFSLYLISRVSDEMNYVIEVSRPMVETTDDIIINTWESLKVVEEFAGEDINNVQSLRDYEQEFGKLYGALSEAADDLGESTSDQAIQISLDKARTELREYRAHARDMMQAHRAGNTKLMADLLSTAEAEVDDAIVYLDMIVERADELGLQADIRSEEAATFATVSLWIALVLGFVIALAVGFIIARRITDPVQMLAGAADRAAGGDLDVQAHVDTNDEVGRLANAFNGMIVQVRRLVEEVKEKSRQAEEAQQRAEAQQAYLSRSVDHISRSMRRFADGDLTVQATPERRGDDIARLFDSFNHAVSKMRGMLGQVHTAIESTSSAAVEISAMSEQLAASAQEQSAQSEEVSASITQMTQTVLENSRSTQEAAQIAKEGGRQAREGGAVVEKTVEKIREIADVVSSSAATVERLGASSKEIGEIVETIDRIADQTSLLALNATIEAARAGEHGRGFAVVADEVQQLARSSAESMKEIARIIQQIQQETSEAVLAMQHGTAHVEEGLELADRTGKALKVIVESTAQIEEVISRVAAGSEEQSATSAQISQSVQVISTVSHDSATAVTQVSGSATDLEQLTTGLRDLVQQFRLDEREAGLQHARLEAATPRYTEPYDGDGGDGDGDASTWSDASPDNAMLDTDVGMDINAEIWFGGDGQ